MHPTGKNICQMSLLDSMFKTRFSVNRFLGFVTETKFLGVSARQGSILRLDLDVFPESQYCDKTVTFIY